jgi:hypothetical protein
MMKNDQDFYERTLIRLKRQYSKDEVVAALMKKLSEAEIEVGKLKSEIDYLQEELKADVERREINRSARVDVRKEELFKVEVERGKKQRDEIKKLRKVRDSLMGKYAELEKKFNHLQTTLTETS